MTIRHNIRRIGKVKFWALALLPLIYFLSNVVTVYQEIYPHSTVTQAYLRELCYPYFTRFCICDSVWYSIWTKSFF